MMTTQSFYRDRGNIEPFGVPHQQLTSSTYHDRAYPYGFSDQCRVHRAEHEMRSIGQSVNELEVGQGSSPTRKRIAVACARCRKRKIRCSGDPGDGSGCQACRSNGNDISQCTFVRVNSQIIPFIDTSIFLPDGSIQPMHQSSSYSLGSQASSHGLGCTESTRRPSMPVLHTRPSFPLDYDSHWDHSPLDSYTFSTSITPRQDSVSTNINGVQQFRNWNPTRGQNLDTPPTASTTTMYQEGVPAYSSFGVLQAPHFAYTQSDRLSSGAIDSFSSLNMNSLQSSLPTQTATTSRQLPVPHLLRIPSHPHPSVEIPDIRPLNSPNPQCGPAHSIHGLNAFPWSSYEDNIKNSASSNDGLNMPPIPYTAEQQSSSSTAVPEPFGYQIPRPSSSSSDASPTAPTTDNLPNHPTSATRYSLSYYPTATMLPPIAAEEQKTAGSAAAHQNTYSNDTGEPQYSGQPSHNSPYGLSDSTHGNGSYARTYRHHGQQQQQSQCNVSELSAKPLRHRSSGEQQERPGGSRGSVGATNGKH